MTGHASGHRWGSLDSLPLLGQGLMRPAEIVVHVVERHGVAVVFHLLTVAVREAGQPSDVHSHGQVLALYVARGHVKK